MFTEKLFWYPKNDETERNRCAHNALRASSCFLFAAVILMSRLQVFTKIHYDPSVIIWEVHNDRFKKIYTIEEHLNPEPYEYNDTTWDQKFIISHPPSCSWCTIHICSVPTILFRKGPTFRHLFQISGSLSLRKQKKTINYPFHIRRLFPSRKHISSFIPNPTYPLLLKFPRTWNMHTALQGLRSQSTSTCLQSTSTCLYT